jgi:cytochrome c-L
VFGLGWDGSRWQLQEMAHTNLQFTAGGYDEAGNVLAVDCHCFYTSDRGAAANPPGTLWRVVAADQVPPGAEVARTVSGAGPAAAPGAGVTFLHPMDNTPLQLDLLPSQQITSAVHEFRASKTNPYRGNAAAAAQGKPLYEQWCQACHLPDATGRIGPNLVDGEYRYPRANTEIGEFEIIYAGATGAMQAFGDRITQDDILKIMAYVQSLK